MSCQVALDARGQIDDFKNAKLTYLEDGTPKATIPVGDLKPGLQTVVIPAGMQMSTLSQQIQMTLIKQDGTETASVVLPINSPGFAASSSAASGSSSGSGSSGQANGTPTT